MLGHAGTLVYIGLPAAGRRGDRRRSSTSSTGGCGSSSRTAATSVPEEDFPRLAQLAADGRLDLAGMVTKTIALDDVEQAFADMEAGEVIRSVVVL